MPTLSTDDKARVYLTTGRVRAQAVDARRLVATFTVQGSAQVPYVVRYDHGHWRCTCPARVQACSHVKACALVAGQRGTPTGMPATHHPTP